MFKYNSNPNYKTSCPSTLNFYEITVKIWKQDRKNPFRFTPPTFYFSLSFNNALSIAITRESYSVDDTMINEYGEADGMWSFREK
jgi:hypothetical protein